MLKGLPVGCKCCLVRENTAHFASHSRSLNVDEAMNILSYQTQALLAPWRNQDSLHDESLYSKLHIFEYLCMRFPSATGFDTMFFSCLFHFDMMMV
jgi:hypothetical protein